MSIIKFLRILINPALKWGDNRYVDCIGRIMSGIMFLFVAILTMSLIHFPIERHDKAATIFCALYSIAFLIGALIVFINEYRFWKRS